MSRRPDPHVLAAAGLRGRRSWVQPPLTMSRDVAARSRRSHPSVLLVFSCIAPGHPQGPPPEAATLQAVAGKVRLRRTPTASSRGPPASPDITTRPSPRLRCERCDGTASDDIARLPRRLGDASSAARTRIATPVASHPAADRLSSPSAADQLLSTSLHVLSEVFVPMSCACQRARRAHFWLRRAAWPRMTPRSCSGRSAMPQAVSGSRVARRSLPRSEPRPGVPVALAELGLRSAAFVPMSTDELLVLYRSSGEPFGGTDLHVLASVAQRLTIAAEDRERAVAIECLARSGHLLAPHLEPDALMDTAAELMQQLTMSDDAWIIGIADGRSVPARALRLRSRGRGDQADRPVATAGVGSRDEGQRVDGAPRRTVVRLGSAYRFVHPGAARRHADPAARTRPGTAHGRSAPRSSRSPTIFASYFGTALENAGLYDELRRQATRDGLTGLANRELAEQRLDQALAPGLGAIRRADVLRPRQVQGGQRPARPRGRRRADPAGRAAAAAGRARRRPAGPLRRRRVRRGARRRPRAWPTSPRSAGGSVEAWPSRSCCAASGSPSRPASAASSARAATTTASAMLRDADAAMYVAKASGPGVVEVFDDAASQPVAGPARPALGAAARPGPRTSSTWCYQPSSSSTPDRWSRSRRWCGGPIRSAGAIPPDVFIPMAEETGAIVAHRSAGCWSRRAASWSSGSGCPAGTGSTMSVNLSAVQLRQSDVADRISR